MPAAAVIPAPIAYIKVAAVKKLVVGFLVWCPWVADLAWGSPQVRVSGVFQGQRERDSALSWPFFFGRGLVREVSERVPFAPTILSGERLFLWGVCAPFGVQIL